MYGQIVFFQILSFQNIAIEFHDNFAQVLLYNNYATKKSKSSIECNLLKISVCKRMFAKSMTTLGTVRNQ